MKKVLLILALMLGAFTATLAQSTKDVLYLKNGSVIYGQLIEMVPEKQVKIKTTDGSVFVYNTSEVDRIEKAENAQDCHRFQGVYRRLVLGKHERQRL